MFTSAVPLTYLLATQTNTATHQQAWLVPTFFIHVNFTQLQASLTGTSGVAGGQIAVHPIVYHMLLLLLQMLRLYLHQHNSCGLAGALYTVYVLEQMVLCTRIDGMY